MCLWYLSATPHEQRLPVKGFHLPEPLKPSGHRRQPEVSENPLHSTSMSTPPSPLEGFSQTYSQQYYQYRGPIQTFITDVLHEPGYVKLLSLKDQVSSSIMDIPTEITHTMTQFVWTETTIRVGNLSHATHFGRDMNSISAVTAEHATYSRIHRSTLSWRTSPPSV